MVNGELTLICTICSLVLMINFNWSNLNYAKLSVQDIFWVSFRRVSYMGRNQLWQVIKNKTKFKYDGGKGKSK